MKFHTTKKYIKRGTPLRDAAPIAAHQIKLIHMAVKDLGIEDEVYRRLLKDFGNVETSVEMSFRDASRLITHFVEKGFIIKSKVPRRACAAICRPRPKRDEIPDNVLFLASPDQLSFIDGLKKLVKWRRADGFERWCFKYFGTKTERSQQRIIYSPTASSVIEGLKGMYKSQNGCECPLIGGAA